MKQTQLFSIVIISFTSGYAQTLDFTKANPQPNIMEAYGGVFAGGDVDDDGDIDLFMTGITPQTRSRLYFNNGTGEFTESTQVFPRTGTGQAILKDFDGDTDLDLFFSGINQLNQTFTHIYTNNGAGVFSQVVNAGLPIISKGVAMADVDNDTDLDVIITSAVSGVSDVYLNNGNAVFTAQGNASFTATSGVVAFIDIENDGDQDVIISGGASTKLYVNDGSGVFSLDSNSTLPAISGTDIDVADTDNDGDYDFLINGNNQNLLYLNNGTGIFTAISTNLQQTFGGANAIADLDNDGDQDILIVGTQVGGLPNIYNIVYQNTGNNTFVQTEILGGEYIADCIIDDFNGDGLKDIIIQGFADDTNVYWNTSTVLNVANPAESNQVNVFPNPTTGVLHITGLPEQQDYVIYSVLGSEMKRGVVSTNEMLSVENFSAGIYFIKLGTSNAIKFVKE